MAGVVYPLFVQSAKQNVASFSTPFVTTLTGVTAGNVLVLVLVSQTASTTQIATAVTGGATWTLAGRQVISGSVGVIEIWLGTVATGGSTSASATLATTPQTVGSQLMEFGGVSSYGPYGIIDTSGTTTQASGTTISQGVTPNDMNELLLVASWTANAQTASPGAPWTSTAGPLTGGATQRNGIAFQTSGSVSTSTASWTQTSGAAGAIGVSLFASNPQGFQILNDPTASGNAAVYSPQSRPEKVDIDILQQGFGYTGTFFGCAVTPNTGSDFRYQVDAGTICSLGSFTNISALTAQSISTADPVNPRRDLIYATPTGTVVYAAGTPAAIPAEPQVPANCAALGTIDVPPNAVVCDNTAAASSAHILDRRVVVRPGLLGRAVYNPGTIATPSTSSLTFAAITGVPTVTFTAPPSGRVIYRISGGGWTISGGGAGCVGVWETSLVGGTAQVLINNEATVVGIGTLDIFVTGLVPGSSHTWTTAWALRFGSAGTFQLNVGGDVTSTSSSWGPYVQEVWVDG